MLRQMFWLTLLDNPLNPRKKKKTRSLVLFLYVSHLFVMAVIQKPEPWVVTEKLDRTTERTPWRGQAKRAAIQFAKQNGEMAKPAAVPSLLR